MLQDEIITYHGEIINFLNSCTIYYPNFASVINKTVLSKGYVYNQELPDTWKYFKNLKGEYHESDTMMIVASFDTLTNIEFTKENLALHPKTRKAYQVGSEYHQLLCNKYPDQVDLIKNILYPVNKTTNELLATRELTLIQFGQGILEENEQPFVIDEINKCLDYIQNRWNMSWMEYEDYFYPTFWSIIWSTLYQCVFTTRIKAIHTHYVHTFHIWAYLTSMGLKDYRSILTRKQAMFLYRNMRYIIANRGKNSNLTLLADNLLDELSVALIGKTIYYSTDEKFDKCIKTPVFLSEPIPTKYKHLAKLAAPQSTEEIINILHKLGLDDTPTSAYVAKVEDKLATTPSNTLLTKLLEIQLLPIDRKYEDLLNNFILDTITKMINDDRYIAEIAFVESTTGVRLKLTTKDALILFIYALYRFQGQHPVHIPIYYGQHATYKYDINESMLPKFVEYDGNRYPSNGYIDFDKFVDGVQYPAMPITDTVELSEFIAKLFDKYIDHINTMRYDKDHVVTYVAATLFDSILDRGNMSIELTSYETYVEWLNDIDNEKILSVVAALDKLDNPSEQYRELAGSIISNLIPITSGLLKYMNYMESEMFYDQLKKLFIQLCSYNILFIDTARDKQNWMFLGKISTYIKAQLETIIHAPSTLDTNVFGTTDVIVDILLNTYKPNMTMTSESTLPLTYNSPYKIKNTEITSRIDIDNDSILTVVGNVDSIIPIPINQPAAIEEG